MGGGGRLYIYLSLHCHHQNDFCKRDSAESHFNVSLIVRDKVTRLTVSTVKSTLLKRKESPSGGFEPRSLCLSA